MLMVFGSIAMNIAVPVAQLPRAGDTVVGGIATITPGGRGANQAHAARRFGVPTVMVGAVGDDAFADHALDNLRLAGTDLRPVRHLAGTATGLAWLQLAGDRDRATVIAPGANAGVRAYWVTDDELASCRSLLLQLEVPAEESIALARRARALGCRTLLHAAPWRATPLPPGVFDWVILNAADLASCCAQLRLLVDGEGAAESARRLAAKLHCRVLLTLGATGALIADSRGVQLRRRALQVDVVDPSGAGDTCAGVFAAALNQGFGDARALEHAVVAASLACTQNGLQAAQPTRHRIEDALCSQALQRA